MTKRQPQPDPNVKTSGDSRPADWAWQRSQRMHAKNAATIDRKAERQAARLQARAERRRAREQAQDDGAEADDAA